MDVVATRAAEMMIEILCRLVDRQTAKGHTHKLRHADRLFIGRREFRHVAVADSSNRRAAMHSCCSIVV